MKIVTAEQMQLIDKVAIEEIGIPGLVLMENAGLACIKIIREDYPEITQMRVVVFSGCGNNGGDGLVIARHLFNQGVDVLVFLVGKESQVSYDCGINLRIARKMGILISEITSKSQLEEMLPQISKAGLIVDAIFGTGLSREVSGIAKEVIELINSLRIPVISVDLPSGLNADTGRPLGVAVRANKTITFGLPKLGLILYPGASYAGKLYVFDIGIPKRLLIDPSIKVNLLTKEEITSLLPIHPPDAHKGMCGKVFVLAGSVGMTGAAALTSEGALKVGAGLVTLGIPESLNNIMEVKLTEAMTKPLPQTNHGSLSLSGYNKIMEMIESADTLCIGPGLGQDEETQHLVHRIIEEAKIPMVIDADGINALSSKPEILKNTKARIVLTPHPGEAARFLKVTTNKIQDDRIKAARQIACDFKVICVLKGARTIISDEEGEVFINPTGNVGMASGGMGDVLSGMIAGFISQGLSCLDGARVGVYLHGLSADLMIEEKDPSSLVASDVVLGISKALRRIRNLEIPYSQLILESKDVSYRQ